MADIESRLRELGLTLPAVAAPVAAYVPAVTSGALVWTSGQLPFVDGALPAVGKVAETDEVAGGRPGTVDPARAKELARIAALNALAAVKAEIGDLDRVRRIVKLVGFVNSDPAFLGQPGVVNGASELLGDVFGAVGAHARSAVGVAALPLDAPVEIEIVAEFA